MNVQSTGTGAKNRREKKKRTYKNGPINHVHGGLFSHFTVQWDNFIFIAMQSVSGENGANEWIEHSKSLGGQNANKNENKK